jgi:hypothetical protein
MNTKNIEKSLKENALKLEHGDEQEQRLGKQLIAVMAHLEKHRKSKERPIDADTLKGIVVGTPQLRPQDMRMGGKPPGK